MSNVKKGEKKESKNEFDNTYFKIHYDIYNCYKSWRNSVRKDCNSCKRTIQVLDTLYKQLFPQHEIYTRPSREKLIRSILKDKEVLQCIT